MNITFSIEHHAAGVYTITGYHPTARKNSMGQMLACPPVCEIYFAEPRETNGVTPEILEEVIRRFRADSQNNPTPVKVDSVPPKNKGGRPRKTPDAPETPEADESKAA